MSCIPVYSSALFRFSETPAPGVIQWPAPPVTGPSVYLAGLPARGSGKIYMEWTENTTRYAFVFAYVPETPPAVEFTSLWTPGFEQYDGFNPVSDSPGVLGGDSSTLGQLGVVFPGDTLPGDFPGWAGIPVLSYTWRYSFPARLEVMCQPLT